MVHPADDSFGVAGKEDAGKQVRAVATLRCTYVLCAVCKVLLSQQLAHTQTVAVAALIPSLPHFLGNVMAPAAARLLGQGTPRPVIEAKEDPIAFRLGEHMAFVALLDFGGATLACLGIFLAGGGPFVIANATGVLWNALLSRVFLGRSLTCQKLLACWLVAVGLAISGLGGAVKENAVFGMVATVGSALSYAGQNVCIEAVGAQKGDPWRLRSLGLWGLLYCAMYTLAFTGWHWHSWVVEPITTHQAALPQAAVFFSLLTPAYALKNASWICLIASDGSVGTGVLAGPITLLTWLVSAALLCGPDAPGQCPSPAKITSTIVVGIGLTFYSVSLQQLVEIKQSFWCCRRRKHDWALDL